MVEVRRETSSEAQRTQLVSTLREQGSIVSDRVAEAFLAIPREWFVPVFYEQERQPGHPWTPRTPGWYGEEAAWVRAIYSDRPLVTLVDEHNRAISSSSAPTAMAMMLEALAIQPGMAVLEIGTGSGYNAALLASLTGDPALVHTVELEEHLAFAAERVLHERIGPVAVHVGDGRLNCPLAQKPSDRVIATASSPTLPAAWFEHLSVGGRIVLDLQGSLQQSSFLIVEKTTRERASGSFDPRSLYFMPLRSLVEQPVPGVSALLQQPITQRISLSDDPFSASLFGDRSFLWLLQWMCPGLTLGAA